MVPELLGIEVCQELQEQQPAEYGGMKTYLKKTYDRWIPGTSLQPWKCLIIAYNFLMIASNSFHQLIALRRVDRMKKAELEKAKAEQEALMI